MGRAPGVVKINQYAQRTAPSGPARGTVREIDQSATGISGFLQGVGQAGEDVAAYVERGEQVDLQIERIQQARDEDDARAYSARAVADATNRYATRASEIEANAPDGWRGLTEASNAAWAQIDDEIINAAPTEISRQFVGQHLGLLRSEMVGRQANRERDLRRGWRLDELDAAANTWENVLVTDPTQWGRAHTSMTQTIGSWTDITADDRRDRTQAMGERLAIFAVSGMVQRDPGGALRQLRAAEPEGPFAHLSAEARMRLQAGAQNELDRRTTMWRAGVREQLDGARDLWRLGEQAPNAPSVASVRSALGDSAAAAYEIDLQTASVGSSMQGLSTGELQRMAAAPPLTEGSDRERLDNIVRRRAAAGILEQRADPMAYLQRSGEVNTEGFMEALQMQSFDTIGLHLRRRQAIAAEHTQRLGNVPLVTGPEAAALRRTIDALPTAQARAAAIESLRRSVNDPRAYSQLARTLYPDAPGGQLAMVVAGRRATLEGAPNVTTEVATRRLLDGAAALGSVQNQNTPSEQGAERPRRTFAMPSDADLRRAWVNEVDDAYRGAEQAEAAAFEAFRAAYAGGMLERGDFSGEFNARIAREAAAIASGGVATLGGDTRTLLPWGMSEERFTGAIADGWGVIRQRFGGDIAERPPTQFDYVALGQGRYAVTTRDGTPAKDSQGDRIVIQLPSR